MKRIVVKIGSRVLTKNDGSLNKQIIARLVKDIAGIKKKTGDEIIIVSSGAVSLGRAVKSLANHKVEAESLKYSKAIIEEQILAAVGQPQLMACYIQEFKKYKINCAQLLATRAVFAERSSYLSLRTVTNNLLHAGVVPIFNENDALSPEELDFSDNDQLACMVAAMLVADELVILTDVSGVYDRSPKEKKAKLVPVISNPHKYLNKVDSKSGQGKGGMKSKLLAAALVNNLGIDMCIAGGFEKKPVSNALALKEQFLADGTEHKKESLMGNGTFFPAHGGKLKPLKSWLATSATSRGKIFVSNFLADILKEKKKAASILFNGIENVSGQFKDKEVVEICDVDGLVLGKGLVRFDSKELKERVKGYKERQRSNKGEAKTKNIIAVHYDYFTFC